MNTPAIVACPLLFSNTTDLQKCLGLALNVLFCLCVRAGFLGVLVKLLPPLKYQTIFTAPFGLPQHFAPLCQFSRKNHSVVYNNSLSGSKRRYCFTSGTNSANIWTWMVEWCHLTSTPWPDAVTPMRITVVARQSISAMAISSLWRP